jgi:hypothetical protein
MSEKVTGIILNPGKRDPALGFNVGALIGRERLQRWAEECKKELVGQFAIYIGEVSAQATADLTAIDIIVALIIQYVTESSGEAVVLDNEDYLHTQITDICTALKAVNIPMYEASQGCTLRC